MTLADLTPDIALKALLGDLRLQTGEAEFADVKAYAQGEAPNVGLDEAFVSIGLNGMIEAVTRPMGMFKGNLAIAANVKCYDDGTVNAAQMRQLVSQVEQMCDRKTSGEFYFEFNEYAVIMPVTTDATTGYATTVLNMTWHTIHR